MVIRNRSRLVALCPAAREAGALHLTHVSASSAARDGLAVRAEAVLDVEYAATTGRERSVP